MLLKFSIILGHWEWFFSIILELKFSIKLHRWYCLARQSFDHPEDSFLGPRGVRKMAGWSPVVTMVATKIVWFGWFGGTPMDWKPPSIASLQSMSMETLPHVWHFHGVLERFPLQIDTFHYELLWNFGGKTTSLSPCFNTSAMIFGVHNPPFLDKAQWFPGSKTRDPFCKSLRFSRASHSVVGYAMLPRWSVGGSQFLDSEYIISL